MTGQTVSNFNQVIAALKLLGSRPGGAMNEPARHVQPEKTAYHGRSEVGIPLPGTDRPTWKALRQLERENQILIDHVEKLACALGACPNCWGTIPDCEDCGGIGQPGAFNPDRACFDQFVLPVITRVMNPHDAGPDLYSRTISLRAESNR